MREDVAFTSNGEICRGWFYKAGKSAPAIVMSHGFSAVKEQSLDSFARRFQAAGFAVLVFDYRFLGASGGEPRGCIVPAEQHDDLRAALAWLSSRNDVDANRIGMWGTSYSGGHTLVMAALDPRVKVAVAQVPAIDLMASIVMLAGREGLGGLLEIFAADHAARNSGKPGAAVAVVAPPREMSVLSTPDSYRWFTENAVPGWRNETTIATVARLIEYAPKNFIHLIAPKPLLIQAGTRDALIPIGLLREAVALAGEPKRLDEFDCGHFDLYDTGPSHEQAVSGAVAWFKNYL